MRSGAFGLSVPGAWSNLESSGLELAGIGEPSWRSRCYLKYVEHTQNAFAISMGGNFEQQQVGAIVPSTRFLVDRMISPVPEDYRGQIIELGAGSGALTLRLAARCSQARILACEIN